MAEVEKITAGQVVKGIVDGITKFGVFVKLPDGRKGLVHISEVANTYVSSIEDFIRVQQDVLVYVLEDEGTRIKLSMKRVPQQDQSNQSNPSNQHERERTSNRSEADQRPPYQPGHERLQINYRRGPGGANRTKETKKFPGSFEDKLAKFLKESNERQADLRHHADKRGGGFSFGRPRNKKAK